VKQEQLKIISDLSGRLVKCINNARRARLTYLTDDQKEEYRHLAPEDRKQILASPFPEGPEIVSQLVHIDHAIAKLILSPDKQSKVFAIENAIHLAHQDGSVVVEGCAYGKGLSFKEQNEIGQRFLSELDALAKK
jgi:hypothetical protein